MFFKSTTDNLINYPLSEVIIRGVDGNGGLFFPKTIPEFNIPRIKSFLSFSQKELCCEVLGVFDPEIKKNDREMIIESAFNGREKISSTEKQDSNFNIIDITNGVHGYSLFTSRLSNELFKYYKKSDKKTICIVSTSGDEGSSACELAKENPDIDYVILVSSYICEAYERFIFHKAEGLSNVTVFKFNENIDKVYNCHRSLLSSRLNEYADVFTTNGFNFGCILGCVLQIICAIHELGFVPVKASLPSLNFEYQIALNIVKKLGFTIDGCVSTGNYMSVMRKVFEHGHVLLTARNEKNKNYNMLNEFPAFFDYYFAVFNTTPDVVKDCYDSFTNHKTFYVEKNFINGIHAEMSLVIQKDEDLHKGISDMMKFYNNMYDPVTAASFVGYEAYTSGKDAVDTFFIFKFENYSFYHDLMKDILNFKVDIHEEVQKSFAAPLKEQSVKTANEIIAFINNKLQLC